MRQYYRTAPTIIVVVLPLRTPNAAELPKEFAGTCASAWDRDTCGVFTVLDLLRAVPVEERCAALAHDTRGIWPASSADAAARPCGPQALA